MQAFAAVFRGISVVDIEALAPEKVDHYVDREDTSAENTATFVAREFWGYIAENETL